MESAKDDIVKEAKRFTQSILYSPMNKTAPSLNEKVVGARVLYTYKPSYLHFDFRERADGLHDVFILKIIDYAPFGLGTYDLRIFNREAALLSSQQADIDFQRKNNLRRLHGDYTLEGMVRAYMLDQTTFERDEQDQEYAIIDQGSITLFTFEFDGNECLEAKAFHNSKEVSLARLAYEDKSTNFLIGRFYNYLARAEKRIHWHNKDP